MPSKFSPVQFRPGDLRPELEKRAGQDMSLGDVARRDLGRYYALMHDPEADIEAARRLDATCITGVSTRGCRNTPPAEH